MYRSCGREGKTGAKLKSDSAVDLVRRFLCCVMNRRQFTRANVLPEHGPVCTIALCDHSIERCDSASVPNKVMA